MCPASNDPVSLRPHEAKAHGDWFLGCRLKIPLKTLALNFGVFFFSYDTKLAEAEAGLEMKACRCELLPPPAPDQVRLRRLLPLRDRRF